MSFDLKGTRSVIATPDEIWEAMLDPDVLQFCLPAVQSVERVSDHQFEIVFSKRFGMLPLTLPVHLEISEAKPPKSWKLTARANHNLLGLASAGATISTQPTLVSTDLNYAAFASVGEAVMKLMGDAFQNRIDAWVDRFFDKFQTAITQKRQHNPS